MPRASAPRIPAEFRIRRSPADISGQVRLKADTTLRDTSRRPLLGIVVSGSDRSVRLQPDLLYSSAQTWIEGYTSSEGTEDYNDKLSERRAQAGG